RHTRSDRDWSSDVCSSDLRGRALLPAPDAPSESLLVVGSLTPGEWALVAGAGWLILWSAVIARRQRAVVAALAVCTVGVAGLARSEERRVGKGWGCRGGRG